MLQGPVVSSALVIPRSEATRDLGPGQVHLMAEIPRFARDERGYSFGMTDAMTVPLRRFGMAAAFGIHWTAGEFIPLSSTPIVTDLVHPRSYYLDGAGTAHCGLSLDEINKAITGKSGHIWVDIDICDPPQVDLLKHRWTHPLAVEDALAVNSRPKLEEFPGYLFMIIIGVRFHEPTPDPYDLQTFDLCFFLGPSFLVTVHGGPSQAIDDVAKRIEKNPDLLREASTG